MVTMSVPVQAADGFQAVDKAYEKLEHQLHKLKTKLNRRHHGRPKNYKGSDALGAVAVLEEQEPVVIGEDVEDDGFRIVKSKRFAIHPMSADEAAERMELLAALFFFTNIETSRAAVIYLREDGHLGLIDEAD